MAGRYNLTDPGAVASFLDEMYETLNSEYFSTNISEISDSEKATELKELFLDSVVIPLGEMRNIAKDVMATQNQKMSYEQKLAYAREHTGKSLPAERLKELFDAVKIEGIVDILETLQGKVDSQTEGLDRMLDSFSPADGSQSEYNALNASYKRLRNISEGLEKSASQLESASMLLDPQYPGGGVKKLYEQAKRFELQISQAAQQGR